MWNFSKDTIPHFFSGRGSDARKHERNMDAPTDKRYLKRVHSYIQMLYMEKKLLGRSMQKKTPFYTVSLLFLREYLFLDRVDTKTVLQLDKVQASSCCEASGPGEVTLDKTMNSYQLPEYSSLLSNAILPQCEKRYDAKRSDQCSAVSSDKSPGIKWIWFIYLSVHSFGHYCNW